MLFGIIIYFGTFAFLIAVKFSIMYVAKEFYLNYLSLCSLYYAAKQTSLWCPSANIAKVSQLLA